MRRLSTSPLAVLLLGFFTFGASCDGKSEQGAGNGNSGGGETRPSGPRVENIQGVDTSELTDAEKRVFLDLVNDQLSPCGEPISVARCVSESRRCGKCLPAARFVARLVTEGYERSEIEESYRLRYGRESAVTIDLEGAPVRGSPMAPITIVEYSDFECPYCGAAHPILARLLREHAGHIRLLFKHYPLSGHPHAMNAARAAEAARRQGKFWEMHDLLFENQGQLEQEDLERYAQQLGLDVERFKADLQSEDVQRRIEANRAEGREVGVQGTPTIFVNGRRFNEPVQSLPAYIAEEVEQ